MVGRGLDGLIRLAASWSVCEFDESQLLQDTRVSSGRASCGRCPGCPASRRCGASGLAHLRFPQGVWRKETQAPRPVLSVHSVRAKVAAALLRVARPARRSQTNLRYLSFSACYCVLRRRRLVRLWPTTAAHTCWAAPRLRPRRRPRRSGRGARVACAACSRAVLARPLFLDAAANLSGMSLRMYYNTFERLARLDCVLRSRTAHAARTAAYSSP